MFETSQKIPFEIHLTTKKLAVEEIESFAEFCEKMNGKLLLIELSKGNQMIQPMFGKKIILNSSSAAIKTAKDLAKDFYLKKIPINRIKIETPAEFSDFIAAENSANNYFEWHGKIDFKKVEDIQIHCKNHKTHLSLNALKKEKSSRFLTLREYDSKENFFEKVNSLIADLKKSHIKILKQEYEYCFYDSNKNLDHGWLPE